MPKPAVANGTGTARLILTHQANQTTMEEQFEFEDRYTGYDDGFVTQSKEAAIWGILPFLHRQTAWIWDGRVIAKNTKGQLDETCHHELFGDQCYHVRFRGWFADGILTVMDRECRVKHADDMPETLYSHLLRKFRFKVGQIRFP